MKKLALILGLAAGIATSVYAADFGFEYQTDKYKFIPEHSDVYGFDSNNDGFFDVYWWDKNKDMEVSDDELFVDPNQDGIPDFCYQEYVDWYKTERGNV